MRVVQYLIGMATCGLLAATATRMRRTPGTAAGWAITLFVLAALFVLGCLLCGVGALLRLAEMSDDREAPVTTGVTHHTLPATRSPSRLDATLDGVSDDAATTAGHLLDVLHERFGDGITYQHFATRVVEALDSVTADVSRARNVVGTVDEKALDETMRRMMGDSRDTCDVTDACDVAARAVLDRLDHARATTESLRLLDVRMAATDDTSDAVVDADPLDGLADELSHY